jgi:predicted dinucleotide-binding enzyme
VDQRSVNVTIIGAGNMGRAIGTRAVAGGHRVEIVDRDPDDAKALAEELGDSATALEPDAPFGGDVVVFAVYYPGIKDAVRQYADRIAGKVVVDITNPVDTDTWDKLATPPATSAAEEVAQLVPEGTPVVKAFNTTFASTLVQGEVGGQQLDVLFDKAAVVHQLLDAFVGGQSGVVLTLLAYPEVLLVLANVEQLVALLAADPQVGGNVWLVPERQLEVRSVFEQVPHTV